MKKQIALLLTATFIFALYACGTSSAAPAAQDAAPAPADDAAAAAESEAIEESAEPEEAALPAETEAKTADDYITLLVNDSGKYTDSVNNYCEYHYALPRIELEGSMIDDVNLNIARTINPYIAESYDIINQGLSLIVTDISYDAYLNGDVLSLVSKVHFDYDYDIFYVWNINVETAQAVSNDELFTLSGLNADGQSLADVTAEAVSNYYFENFTKPTSSEWQAEFDATMDAENLAETLYYLDDDGTLQSIIRLHIPIAAGIYNVIVPVTE